MDADTGEWEALATLDAEMDAWLARREQQWERRERMRDRAKLAFGWALVLSPVWWRWLPGM